MVSCGCESKISPKGFQQYWTILLLQIEIDFRMKTNRSCLYQMLLIIEARSNSFRCNLSLKYVVITSWWSFVLVKVRERNVETKSLSRWLSWSHKNHPWNWKKVHFMKLISKFTKLPHKSSMDYFSILIWTFFFGQI